MSVFWFIFRDNDLLLRKVDMGYDVPFSENPPCNLLPLDDVHTIHAVGKSECKVFSVSSDYVPDEEMKFVSLRESYHYLPEERYRAAGVAFQLLYWEGTSRYCSACGALMERLPASGKCCPKCKREFWPRISPAIIVLVKRKEPNEPEKILLVRAYNFRGDFHGLVAGFLEVGESLEECVIREVYEETSLKIKNIKYFGSQSWPYPSGIMIGFVADYDGGEIVVQESELKSASWYTIANLPRIPEKLTIARKLIDYWIDSLDVK
jgi:NAD+ diphosphatase